MVGFGKKIKITLSISCSLKCVRSRWFWILCFAPCRTIGLRHVEAIFLVEVSISNDSFLFYFWSGFASKSGLTIIEIVKSWHKNMDYTEPIFERKKGTIGLAECYKGFLHLTGLKRN